MRQPRRDEARVAAGSGEATTVRHGNEKSAATRPEFQGHAGNARCAAQRPPVWTPAPGTDAAQLLERLWGRP